MEVLLSDLQKCRVEEEGTRLFRTIMPHILSDFNQLLSRSRIGVTVSEEYRLDDGSGSIIIEGEREANGAVQIRGHMGH